MEKLTYSVDGGHVDAHYNLTGQAYTSYEIDYDHTGRCTAENITAHMGLSYTSTEKDYVWSSTTGKYTLVDTEYFNS